MITIEEFKKLEADYLKKVKEEDRLIPQNDNDKSVLDCGDGWHWVLLDRNQCSEEGDAMGHCGNSGDPRNGQRLLSLRKEIKRAGKDYWQPAATFILNKDGSLGETIS